MSAPTVAPTVAFDVFGTLADPASYALGLRPHTSEPEVIAASWRRYQLEISWLLTAAGRKLDWSTVTAQALDMALAATHVQLGEQQRAAALERVAVPELFEGVPEVLDELAGRGTRMAVFSNGDVGGLDRILAEHGIADRFEEVVGCSEVGAFKPAPETYRHLAARLEAPLEGIWLVSANPFDCAGAALVGMRVAQLASPASPKYPFAPEPELVLDGLAQLPEALPWE
ncbi:HAD family hydrolase [Actinopolyspora saharensis]|uniref:HAD family hydrolase n=1 Tax=Actinopolyspora saharensis TaxID=995062 RepID=UPI003F67FDA4